MSLIFLSYRREDSAGYAGRLHESLERRLGAGEVFRDVDAIEPGQDFAAAIAARLADCGACVVVIGREWVDARDTAGRRRLDQENDYVRMEVAEALARPDALVVPVLVEGVSMPSADQLPEPLRALPRRQGLSLRDETWDADVDRLVNVVRKATGRGAGVRATRVVDDARRSRMGFFGASPVTWGLIAAAVLAAIFVTRAFRGADETSVNPPPASRESGGRPGALPAAHAIAIPRIAEFANGDLIYTLLSGSVAEQEKARVLRLRFRLSNDGAYGANFWDGSFRLVAQGQMLAPTSGLNEVVAGHAVQQGIVSFELPANVTTAVLQVLAKPSAELPLNLVSTGAPSAVDDADTSDALAHAISAELLRDPHPLASASGISFDLLAVTARRFVNTVRIIARVRLTNRRGAPLYFGTDAIRLVADGQATAPFKGPGEVVAADASETSDFVFDVPPSVRRVILRMADGPTAEVPFELPAALH